MLSLSHKIQRSIFTEKSSIGYWSIDGIFQCFTLEDKDREPLPWAQPQAVSNWKVAGTTAIPRGKYKLELTFSQRFQRVMPQIIAVPGFTGIRVHSGNRPEDTEGCVIVGQDLGEIPDQVLNSKPAFAKLFEIIKNGGDSQWLEIC